VFSMFSSNPTSKPTIKITKSENGYIVYSQHYDLPKKRVLFLTHNQEESETTLKIFSIHDLTTCLLEKKFTAFWQLLCIFPDGTLLLNNDRINNNNLMKLCSNSLTVLSTKTLAAQCYPAGVIDNEHFFLVESEDSKHCVVIYQYRADNHSIEGQRIKLLTSPKSSNSYMYDIQSLGNNRYCCHISDYYTDEFGVFVFEINAKTLEVKELGVITPKAHHNGVCFFASGKITVLPNGQLLTYHEQHDNLQLWDTGTLQCVQEWNWADTAPKKFSVSSISTIRITSFPDSIHLLVQNWQHAFLFNMKSYIMKPITLPNGIANYAGQTHILPNGEVIAFIEQYKNMAISKIVQFELPEMINYRKVSEFTTESQHLARLVFNRHGLPVEVTDYIFSYAFTNEAKAILAKKIAEQSDHENQKGQDCFIM